MAQYVDNLEVAGKALATAREIFTGRSFPRDVFVEKIRPTQFRQFHDVFEVDVWEAWFKQIGLDPGSIVAWDAGRMADIDYVTHMQKLPLAIGESGMGDLLALLNSGRSIAPTLEFRWMATEVWMWDRSSSWACWAHQNMDLAVYGVSPAFVPDWRLRRSSDLAFDEVVGTACQYWDELPDPRGWLERHIADNYAAVWD